MGAGYSPKRTGAEQVGKTIRDLRASVAALNKRISALGLNVNKADSTLVMDGTTITGATIVADGTSGEILVYKGTPAAGNMIAAFSGAFTTDGFGNNVERGLTLVNVSGSSADGAAYFVDVNTTTGRIGRVEANHIGSTWTELRHLGPQNSHSTDSSPSLSLGFSADTADSDHYILAQVNAGTITHSAKHHKVTGTGADFTVGNAGGSIGGTAVEFQLNNGLKGGYYSEEVTLDNGQSLPNNTRTQLTTFSAAQLNSDYGSAFNLSTGVWTCPVSADYDITFQMQMNTASSGRVYMQVFDTPNNVGYLQFEATLTGGNTASISGTRYIPAGTQLGFWFYQNSGAARTVSTSQNIPYIKMCRRL